MQYRQWGVTQPEVFSLELPAGIAFANQVPTQVVVVGDFSLGWRRHGLAALKPGGGISFEGLNVGLQDLPLRSLWKSVKYAEIYLHGYGTVSEVRQALTRYFDFYNRLRPHSTLDGQTPDTAYFNQPLLAAAA